MGHPVETFCNTLARARLLEPEAIRELHQRWSSVAGPHVQDLDRFRAWLVSTHAVSEFQLGFLDRGHAEQLFFGPYKLRARIGKGRLAGVYEAVHPEGSTVAIKVLPASKARDPLVLGRFRREARLASKLNHPHLVRTFQTGVAHGLHYLVMEHLEGETLEEVLRRRRTLPVSEAVRLIHQALLGLDQLHEQGLIHRDLEPANLMLVDTHPDSTCQATLKILDIGLGKALFDEEGTGIELTNEDDLLGTVEYVAPEQARDPRVADIRSDIYTLGCVLYRMLTGQPPFTDSNRVRLLVRAATETPRPVRAFDPSIPEGLELILDGMLTRDPASRHPTPRHVAQALERFLASGPQGVPLEADPRMSRYLQWLANQTADDPALPPLPSGVPPVPVPPPLEVFDVEPVVVPPPLPALPRDSGPAVPPLPVFETFAPPGPKKRSGRTGRDKGKPIDESILLGLGRRDILMLAIGMGGLAVVSSIGLAVWAIVRRGN